MAGTDTGKLLKEHTDIESDSLSSITTQVNVVNGSRTLGFESRLNYF